MRRSILLGSSVVAALAASLCCILPVVATVTGLAAIGVAATFASVRPYLLALTVLLFLIGVVIAYRDRRRCEPQSLCATKPVGRWNIIGLAFIGILILALALFPAYSGSIARAVAPKAAMKRVIGHTNIVSFLIPDMDCGACAVSLQAAFERLPGVAKAAVDYPTRRAQITYDPRKQQPEAFSKLVSQAGFHAQLRELSK